MDAAYRTTVKVTVSPVISAAVGEVDLSELDCWYAGDHVEV